MMSLTAIIFDSSAASMASRATNDFIPFGVLARVTSPRAARRLETARLCGEGGDALEVGDDFDAGDAFVLADDVIGLTAFLALLDFRPASGPSADEASAMLLEEGLGMIRAEGER